MMRYENMAIEAFEYCIVRLPARGCGSVELDMSEEKRSDLIDTGYQVTDKHLLARETDRDLILTRPAGSTELANKLALGMLAQ